MDPYKILNVESSANDETIKKAYRKLAAKHHPDKGGNEEKFKKINEAYSLISTKEKRQEHSYRHSASHNPFGDIFGGFGDIFEGFFGCARY